MTLPEFLAARLHEDEATANAVGALVEWSFNAKMPMAVAEHIARQDPARALRDVEAKRAILDRHRRQAQDRWNDQRVIGEGTPFCGWCSDREEQADWPCPDVLDLAAVWSDHPGYDPSWRT